MGQSSATVYIQNLYSYPDSILGLGFPALSNLGRTPFFNSAKAQGSVLNEKFGFFLASENSELHLGDYNASHYTGALEAHTVDSASLGFWQITGAKALIGSTTVVSGFKTIIDSGTTIMYGPPAAVKTFYSKISGSAVFDPENGFYSFPCSSVPPAAFSWGGKSWAVSAAK